MLIIRSVIAASTSDSNNPKLYVALGLNWEGRSMVVENFIADKGYVTQRQFVNR